MTSAAMHVEYEYSIVDTLKESASAMFSEIRRLIPKKDIERELDVELSKTLASYNTFSSVLGALSGVIKTKIARLESGLENVKFGDPRFNDNDALSSYWSVLGALLEAYIELADSALDEIETTEHKRGVLIELHSSLLFLRKQLIEVFDNTEDLIELISVHDALTEVRA